MENDDLKKKKEKKKGAEQKSIQHSFITFVLILHVAKVII
jgi:hypothetical protein